jgi:hypothetical protein
MEAVGHWELARREAFSAFEDWKRIEEKKFRQDAVNARRATRFMAFDLRWIDNEPAKAA